MAWSVGGHTNLREQKEGQLEAAEGVFSMGRGLPGHLLNVA